MGKSAEKTRWENTRSTKLVKVIDTRCITMTVVVVVVVNMVLISGSGLKSRIITTSAQRSVLHIHMYIQRNATKLALNGTQLK